MLNKNNRRRDLCLVYECSKNAFYLSLWKKYSFSSAKGFIIPCWIIFMVTLWNLSSDHSNILVISVLTFIDCIFKIQFVKFLILGILSVSYVIPLSVGESPEPLLGLHWYQPQLRGRGMLVTAEGQDWKSRLLTLSQLIPCWKTGTTCQGLYNLSLLSLCDTNMTEVLEHFITDW